jgi:anaerobic magnesium-protoporphyrin IX monomethyl ester cyclase
MMRVLFVNAVDPISEVENRYRPLWPAYLVAYTEKHLGVDKLEFRFMTRDFEDELRSFKPNIVAISAVSQNYNLAMKYAGIAKEYGLAVVMGGIHISYMPHCLTKDMDIGCMGEGEDTFLELMRHYLDFGDFSRVDLGRINGIVYHDGGKLVRTPDRPMLHSLDQLPHPKRSIIGYQSHDYMFTSRGCPYRCVFCASSRYWRKVRWASSEYVIDEIHELIEKGVKTISFYDDLFTVNKKRLRQIADMIVASGFHRRVNFTCSCRANDITLDVVKVLKSMNVVSVGMGLESGCDRSLGYLKENVSVKDNWQAINFLKDAGIQANASFIIGAPDETEEEIMQTYDFIKKSRLDFVDIYTLTPFPGTPVWDYAAKKNLVSDDMDWSRLNVNLDVNKDFAIFVSERLSRQQLLLIYKKFRKLRFYRMLKALPTSAWLRDLPKVASMVLFEKLLRILRTLRKKTS